MKPILFNTDMVRAILNGPKTVTRRVVKPHYRDGEAGFLVVTNAHTGKYVRIEIFDEWENETRWLNEPYRPGDILYVRETFQIDYLSNIPGSGRIRYKADDTYSDFTFAPERYDMMRRAQLKPGWRPNENMPREAARIFLRVTDVRVERLQDSFFKHGSTIFSFLREGIDIGGQCRECIDAYGSPCCIDSESECGVLDEVRSEFADLWNRCYAAPRPVKGEDGTIDHYESYPWEDIQETRTYKGNPWYVIGNPWVWVIEFERVNREKATHHGH